MRPNASNLDASLLGKSLAMCSTSGPRGLHAVMNSATSLSWGPVKSFSTFLAVARLLEGTCATTASTRPAALPNTAPHASLSSGLVSMAYDALRRYTPSVLSTCSIVLGCSPMTWLYTLYSGSRMNCTKERSTPARPAGAFLRNMRLSSWNQMSPHNRLANSLWSNAAPVMSLYSRANDSSVNDQPETADEKMTLPLAGSTSSSPLALAAPAAAAMAAFTSSIVCRIL
mmetsp:Transcript_22656/g.57693  ORF Transcript_22656/g.57693 Transcript_22656/m.57693 type:complete len:228 (+) Transcript_22656:1971-2654(+)